MLCITPPGDGLPLFRVLLALPRAEATCHREAGQDVLRHGRVAIPAKACDAVSGLPERPVQREVEFGLYPVIEKREMKGSAIAAQVAVVEDEVESVVARTPLAILP